jgi:uncharacterized protein (TIGR04145 family)
MRFHKSLLVTAVALGLIGAAALNVSDSVDAATGITIDGQFSDWDNYNSTGATWWDDGTGNMTSLIKLAADTQTVDVYAQVHEQNSTNTVPGALWQLTVGGKSIDLQVGGSSTSAGDVTVVLNDQSAVVGTGKVVRSTANGKYTSDYSTVEFSVNLAKAGVTDAKLGDIVSLNPQSTGMGNGTATTTIGSIAAGDVTGDVPDDNSSDTNSSSTDGSVDNNGVVTGDTTADTGGSTQNNSNDNLPIVIDGAYKDWANITLTKVAGDNIYNSRYMAMVSDGKYVYVYVKMQPYDAMPGYGDYNFTIGGKKYFVWSNDMPSSLTTDGESQKVTMTAGDYNEGNQYGTVGYGYVHRSTLIEGGQSYGWYDVMEFKVDLSKLKVATTGDQNISMSNPNVGNGAVTAAGGSTGPVLLASAGVILAGIGYMKVQRKGLFARNAIRVSGK